MGKNRNEVIETLFETIQAALNRPPGEILTEDTRLFEEGGLDSIDLFTLEAAIREEFSIRYSNQEADEFKQMTVGEITDFIVIKLAELAA